MKKLLTILTMLFLASCQNYSRMAGYEEPATPLDAKVMLLCYQDRMKDTALYKGWTSDRVYYKKEKNSLTVITEDGRVCIKERKNSFLIYGYFGHTIIPNSRGIIIEKNTYSSVGKTALTLDTVEYLKALLCF